ncbi:MAG: type III secretion system export apparatus subunit SctR [Candidatus Eisenbacteria bacterium]|nr:type III secretion system export apparatus subunit SctR [Candidatus Eisenbacteria bacterium]MCC7144698.1 type III secretion system export apparatus subunit SctR [Candidatus Eisenbacteria bacterium]
MNRATRSGRKERGSARVSTVMRGRPALVAGLVGLLLGIGGTAWAQASPGQFSSPITLVMTLGALSLAPFIVIMLTSFVKISVVLSILRNAIGTQQIPPNQVVTGFAFVLTIFIMLPVAQKVYQAANLNYSTAPMMSERSVRDLFDGAKRGKEPVRDFLDRHVHTDDRVLFAQLAQQLQGSAIPPIDPKGFQVLIPGFVTSELKEAFLIGFILFIPFLVIDMVVANILMALGMMMLSPTTISLPFKLLLFVLIDGWTLVVKGLVMDYIPR